MLGLKAHKCVSKGNKINKFKMTSNVTMSVKNKKQNINESKQKQHKAKTYLTITKPKRKKPSNLIS